MFDNDLDFHRYCGEREVVVEFIVSVDCSLLYDFDSMVNPRTSSIYIFECQIWLAFVRFYEFLILRFLHFVILRTCGFGAFESVGFTEI